MPRLPRRYTLRQKSPNAPPRIRGALREVSDITLTLADFDWAAYNEGCQKAIAAMKNARNPMALGNNVWPAGVPFDWEAFTRAAAKQEEHYKKLGLIKCSEVSDRSDTEPESEALETKERSMNADEYRTQDALDLLGLRCAARCYSWGLLEAKPYIMIELRALTHDKTKLRHLIEDAKRGLEVWGVNGAAEISYPTDSEGCPCDA